jgi:hypothetical protein
MRSKKQSIVQQDEYPGIREIRSRGKCKVNFTYEQGPKPDIKETQQEMANERAGKLKTWFATKFNNIMDDAICFFESGEMDSQTFNDKS